MPTKGNKKSKPVNDLLIGQDEKPVSIWSIHGTEDIQFQRGAQVTLWSVMGGLQVGALLTQTGSLWEQLQAGRWYLAVYLIDSLLIIALIWALSSWGSLVLKWPITIPTILTQFSGNFALAISCLLIVNPAGWALGIAISSTCNWIHHNVLSRSGAWETFSPEMYKALKANLWIYALWPLLAFAGAVHMYLVPSVLVQTVWGVIGLAVIIEGLFRQHHDMERDRKKFGIP